MNMVQPNGDTQQKSLVVFGGAEGHKPKEVAEILAGLLKEEHNSVDLSNTLDRLKDPETLKHFDLIVLIWTTGTITKEQLDGLLHAVQEGTGFVGFHAAVGAFRNEIAYHEMIGGQFLAHPGGTDVTYRVHISDKDHPIMKGIEDFTVTTEKYYMMIDPAIRALMTTTFNDVVMPVAWTKTYGNGRVFYNSLGHTLDVVNMPQVLTMMRNGMIWAAR